MSRKLTSSQIGFLNWVSTFKISDELEFPLNETLKTSKIIPTDRYWLNQIRKMYIEQYAVLHIDTKMFFKKYFNKKFKTRADSALYRFDYDTTLDMILVCWVDYSGFNSSVSYSYNEIERMFRERTWKFI